GPEGRQELPVREALRAGGVAPALRHPPGAGRRRPLRRPVHGRQGAPAHAARPAPDLPGAHLPQLRGLPPAGPALPLLPHPPLRPTGRNDERLARLKREMATAAASRQYEVAAQRRDQIAVLERARVPQAVVSADPRDTDVLGFARHGDRAVVATLFLREGRVI